jgi:CheY-like chemotaxis protein
MNPAALARVRALVVDDSRCMRDLLKTILESLGVGNVITAEDGAHGLAEMKSIPPDIVFVDWMMTPLDGIEFTRMVRTAPDSPCPYVPIIMVTGHTEAHRIRQARDVGITEFLAKPVSAKSVYQRIYSVVEHPRSFIRSKSYFGPDRRRQVKEHFGSERRADMVAEAGREDVA